MRIIATIMCVILFIPALAASQDDVYVISDFALGKGMSMDNSFIRANMPVLRIVADRLNRDPLLHAEIRAWADSTRYRLNHDAQNAATALSRYDLIAGILIDSLGVDSSQISPAYTRESWEKGGSHRKVEICLKKLPEYATRLALDSLRDELSNEINAREPGHTYTTNVYNFFSLVEIGVGASSHLYGNAVPILHGRLGNSTVSIEATFGNSLFKKDEPYLGQILSVKYTIVGIYFRYLPSWELPIALAGGWERLEARSTAYGRYLEKSEGPALGIIWNPWRHVRLASLWTPAEEDKLGNDHVSWDYNQFRVELAITKLWEK